MSTTYRVRASRQLTLFAQPACQNLENHRVKNGYNDVTVEDFLVRTRLSHLLLFLCLTALSGCQKEEPIAQYKVEHPDRYALRMLAAIIPGEDKSFFVDLLGPKAIVDRQKENFDKFLGSLQLDETKEKLTWKVPDGWKQQPDRQMRVATFVTDIKDEPLEIKITQFGGSVLDNVNRWRKKLTLPPLKTKDLVEAVEWRKLGQRKLAVVDLVGMGEFHVARPAAPLAAPPLIGRSGPPVKATPFKYKVPGDWKPKAAGQFIKEAFVAGEGAKQVPVTLSSFGGDAGGLVANINRWRNQVGLEPLPEAGILKEAKSLKISGKLAHYVDLANPKNDVRILGVILPLATETWFVKMTGPVAAVEAQRGNFEAFVQSFELEER